VLPVEPVGLQLLGGLQLLKTASPS
jgi:hypothetical protein